MKIAKRLKIPAVLTAALAAALAAPTLAPAASADTMKMQAGTLVCELTSKTNLILVSKRRFHCHFNLAGSSSIERYRGEVTNVGADLEVTSTEQIVWLVLAPSVNIPAGALAGKYLGAGASATAGVGVGARALIGGVDNSISLQPLSLSGSKGFGASAVISGMVLRFEG